MKQDEFIELFTNETKADADALQIPTSEAFLRKVADQLVESEVISDYEIGFFTKTGRNNRQLKMDGYYYEYADATFSIFIVDDLDDIQGLLNNALVDKYCKLAEELVYVSIEERYKTWEQSSSGYIAAKEINELYSNLSALDNDRDLKKIRIFIISNKQLSKQFTNSKRDNIEGVPVEYSIYDSNRLYDMAKSGFSKEPVDIEFQSYGISGLYGIKTVEKDKEFVSYLTAIPGVVLANIYLDKGTQILEGNVRSFLSVRGKINKGIRKTILEEPEKFFILNNGITVTSDGIETTENEQGLLIYKIKNMQIVNGGQTTASLANVILKENADLSKVHVMMKLTVLKHQEINEEIIPQISRASNSQNKVDEADFFSNHPFHIKLEELSRKNLAPAIDGNQYQTSWFYERARGQYTVQEMRKTASELKAWRLRNPKRQVIKKTDVAKYYMSYDCKPHEVSKGAQAVMKKFAEFMQGSNGEGYWDKNSSEVNNEFFKELIAKAIIFKETERIVSNSEWYKEIRAYRANIVTYTIAVIANECNKVKKKIDLKKIWNGQSLYDELIRQIVVTSKEVYQFLTLENRATQNVTEWAKREEAWKRAQKYVWTVNDSFINTLIDITKAKSSEVTEALVDSMIFVDNKDLKEWVKIKEWGKKYLYLTYKDESFLNLAIDYHLRKRVPSDKQFKAIVGVYNKLIREGYKEE